MENGLFYGMDSFLEYVRSLNLTAVRKPVNTQLLGEADKEHGVFVFPIIFCRLNFRETEIDLTLENMFFEVLFIFFIIVVLGRQINRKE